eukprot:g5001.t1
MADEDACRSNHLTDCRPLLPRQVVGANGARADDECKRKSRTWCDKNSNCDAVYVVAASADALANSKSYRLHEGCKSYTGPLDEDCGRSFGITNLGHVKGEWKVYELELFWDPACTLQVFGEPFEHDLRVRRAMDPAKNAFDNDTSTWYRPLGEEGNGGVGAGAIRLGLHTRFKPQVISFRENGWTLATVRGLRIWQGENPKSLSLRLRTVIFLGDRWFMLEVDGPGGKLCLSGK